MGAFCKLIDAILFVYFALASVIVLLFDVPMILPDGIVPSFIVHLNRWSAAKSGDYLTMKKPHFLIGIVWNDILLLWSLTVANIYAYLAGKSWFGTVSLVYGASVVTAMAAILGEMIGSGKASERMMMMYAPFMGFGILALLHGLLSQSNQSGGAVGKTILARRKRS